MVPSFIPRFTSISAVETPYDTATTLLGIDVCWNVCWEYSKMWEDPKKRSQKVCSTICTLFEKFGDQLNIHIFFNVLDEAASSPTPSAGPDGKGKHRVAFWDEPSHTFFFWNHKRGSFKETKKRCPFHLIIPLELGTWTAFLRRVLGCNGSGVFHLRLNAVQSIPPQGFEWFRDAGQDSFEQWCSVAAIAFLGRKEASNKKRPMEKVLNNLQWSKTQLLLAAFE